MIRKKHSSAFKAKVALEALKELKTVNQIARQFGVHPNQVSQWKKAVSQSLPDIFSDKRKRDKEDEEKTKDRLYHEIGKLKFELDWLKKKMGHFD